MTQKKEYRSSIRSRRMIRQAFLELLQEKSFEKITVTDIVNRADINRSTYYAHYPDLMGLVDEILNEIIDYSDHFWSDLKIDRFFQDPMPELKKIVNLLEENHQLYKLLGQSDLMLCQLSKIKQAFIHNTLHASNIPEQLRSSLSCSIRIRFFIGGIFDVYTQWLFGELECSLDQITADIAALIVNSSKDFDW